MQIAALERAVLPGDVFNALAKFFGWQEQPTVADRCVYSYSALHAFRRLQTIDCLLLLCRTGSAAAGRQKRPKGRTATTMITSTRATNTPQRPARPRRLRAAHLPGLRTGFSCSVSRSGSPTRPNENAC
jgi:hypothetical protein